MFPKLSFSRNTARTRDAGRCRWLVVGCSGFVWPPAEGRACPQGGTKKEEPKKDAPKPEPKKSDVPAVPGFPDLKELLPADVPPEVAEQLKKQMEKFDEMIRRCSKVAVSKSIPAP